jgi:hypothetical protein
LFERLGLLAALRRLPSSLLIWAFYALAPYFADFLLKYKILAPVRSMTTKTSLDYFPVITVLKPRANLGETRS